MFSLAHHTSCFFTLSQEIIQPKVCLGSMGLLNYLPELCLNGRNKAFHMSVDKLPYQVSEKAGESLTKVTDNKIISSWIGERNLSTGEQVVALRFTQIFNR